MSGGDMAWRIGGEPVKMKRGVLYSFISIWFHKNKNGRSLIVEGIKSRTLKLEFSIPIVAHIILMPQKRKYSGTKNNMSLKICASKCNFICSESKLDGIPFNYLK